MTEAKLREKQIAALLSAGDDALDDPLLQQALDQAEAELRSAIQGTPPSNRLHPGRFDAGDSAMLRRFLVARKLHIDATMEMLEKHAAWREGTLPVNLTEDLVGELRKGKGYPQGVDLRGRQLIVVRSRCEQQSQHIPPFFDRRSHTSFGWRSNFDPKVRDLETAIRAVTYLVEKCCETAPASGPQSQFVIFYDRSDFSLSKNLDREMIKGVVSTLSDNYPERLGAVYIYPAGPIVNVVFKVISPFMDPRRVHAPCVHLGRRPARVRPAVPLNCTGEPFPRHGRTRAKVHVVTSDAMLATLIPKEHIPQRYGGTSSFEFDPSVYQLP